MRTSDQGRAAAGCAFSELVETDEHSSVTLVTDSKALILSRVQHLSLTGMRQVSGREGQ